MKTAKAIRNEAARVRALPIDAWLADIGFTTEEINVMKADFDARTQMKKVPSNDILPQT